MPLTVEESAALPALSRQLPVLVTEAFCTSAVNVCPATLLVSRPDSTAPVSAQVKFTVTSVLFQPLPLAAGVRPPVIAGLVLSIFTVTLAIALVLPALSVHVPLTSVPLVSAVRPLPVVQLSIPLLIVPTSPLSLKVTATSVLFQPLTLAAGALTAVGGLGGVLSMLMPLTVEESAALPALSRQLPVLVTEAFCTSAVNVCPATLLVSRPDSTAPVSAQVKFTVTSVLFQPLPLAAGVRPPVITGLVLSIFTVTLAIALVLPALSVHVPLTSVPLVSAVRPLPVVQPSIPLLIVPASPLSLKVTATSVLFQPLTLAAGALTAVGGLGGVLSILLSLTLEESAALPALSWQLPVLVTEAFCTSAVNVCPATLLVSRPDSTAPVSAQVKFTVTSVLFQPLPLAAGVRPPVITGLVLSIFTVTLAIALVLPALSVHVPLTSVPLVSAVKLLPVVQPSIPLFTPPASPLSLNVTATSVLFQPLTLAAGALTAVGGLGGVLSILLSLTLEESAALPALSWQLPVLVTEAFCTSAVNVCPATLLVSRPDSTAPVSAQVKFTVTSVLFQPLPLAAGVRPPVIAGLVLSIFTVTLAIALVLPALSVHVPLTSVPLVSAVKLLPVVQPSIPLFTPPASPLSLNVTATSVLFQPLTLAAGALTAVGGLGGVLSILMPLTVEESAALPALSRQLPVLVTEAFCTSAVNVCPATLLVSRPDCTAPVSAQVKFTVTSVLFQPLALAAGVRPPVITGLVLSIFTVTLAIALVLPALSVHVPLTSVPLVSAVRPLPVVQLSIPLLIVPASPLSLKVTATSVLFQPLTLAAGALTAVGGLGGVLSILMPLTVEESAALPALSRQLPVLVTEWFWTSVVTVAPATVLVSSPEPPVPAPAQVKFTVTSVLFQPLPLAAGVRPPVITGLV